MHVYVYSYMYMYMYLLNQFLIIATSCFERELLPVSLIPADSLKHVYNVYTQLHSESERGSVHMRERVRVSLPLPGP